MEQEIQLISDGDGVAVIGDPTAVDMFLSSANLSSKELPLGKLGSAARSGGAARAGSAALETGAEIAANSGRWLKLTEESANALKLGTAMCGNSGNSSNPHLHFHLMDGPDTVTARGLPFQWEYADVHGAPHSGVPAKDELFDAGARAQCT